MTQLQHLTLLIAEQQSALERMDPKTRIGVILTLIALVCVGLLLMGFAFIGGRMTRRYINRKSTKNEPPPHQAPREDDWATKPLTEDERDPQD